MLKMAILLALSGILLISILTSQSSMVHYIFILMISALEIHGMRGW